MAIINYNSSDGHRWKFFRIGGFDQVYLGSADDLMCLEKLDQKLWSTLSCPTLGLEFDSRTLELIDSDGDGRIRPPEIIEAVKWTGLLLKDPERLLTGSPALELSSINDASDEGCRILNAARQILKVLGKDDALEITADDVADVEGIISRTNFNGDGIITADAASDISVRQVIEEIINCLGPDKDRSGKPGISGEKLEQFYSEAREYSEWLKIAEVNANTILPCGNATERATEVLLCVREKIDDYFTRCHLAAYDARALGAINGREEEYAALANKSLSPSLEEISGFPLAQVEVDNPLPLKNGINPAWKGALVLFEQHVLNPLVGEKPCLTEADWESIKRKFLPYLEWLQGKKGSVVEGLGAARVREILQGNSRGIIAGLIDEDLAAQADFENFTSVEKLVRYNRDLFTLLNNFVSFSDFYNRKKAIFQAGSLYLDGRSCELCIRVDDIGSHAGLASLSRIFLAYCDCRRRGGTEKMTIAAAFTGGDSDFLMVGRNGIFYDRKGQDWDATVVRVIDNPISIRQAFWRPYKQLAQMIGRQISKLAAARDKALMDKASTGIAETSQKVIESKAVAPAAPPPFDVAKFAGIFAAIGLAVGFIGTAIMSVVTGFMKLAWWQMPLALVGVMLAVSAPSVVIASLKLRQRTLGPILDANGWAVNARVRINVAFGSSLTKLATLPLGALRSLEDPFADKKRPWPLIAVAVVIVLVILYFLNSYGFIYRWIAGMIGLKP